MRSTRTIACLLALGLVSSAAPATAPPTIGVLSLEAPGDAPCVGSLRRALGEMGDREGRDYVVELRLASGRMDLLPGLAEDLVQKHVSIMVSASGPAAPIAKNASASIPIVLASSFYPVEAGLVSSLAHPGGNVTGVTHFTPELMRKRVQLLKEMLPGASRIVMLRTPGRLQDLVAGDMTAAARSLELQLHVVEIRRTEDLAPAFDAAAKWRAQAVTTTQDSLFWRHRATIAQLALKHHLPSLSGEPNAAEAGALAFYGPDVFEGCARAARYVDRILKGAKPADLPMEEPTTIKMVINLKTARALRLTIPPALLARADQVIE
jgi:putative ABC transport system substrate-binding protein